MPPSITEAQGNSDAKRCSCTGRVVLKRGGCSTWLVADFGELHVQPADQLQVTMKMEPTADP